MAGRAPRVIRLLLLASLAAALVGRAAAQERPKRVLFIGQAKGYQHEAITTAMVDIYNLGKKSGEWETVFRTDCTAITKKPLKWEAKNIDQYDVVVFFTDGELDMDDSQKADLLSFVRDDGKAFVGIHSATVTFDSWPEYKAMIGGYFDGHPWGQIDAPLVVVDPKFPGMDKLEPRFTMKDEIYQIKDFVPENVRVLLRLDRDKVDLKHAGVHPDGNTFPLMWAKNYGKGRVLYNALGHRHEVWERPDMLSMWLEQMRWALGTKPGDATPNP